MMSVRVDFSRGGIECRWCACLWAGALNGVGFCALEGMLARCMIGDEDGCRRYALMSYWWTWCCGLVV